MKDAVDAEPDNSSATASDDDSSIGISSTDSTEAIDSSKADKMLLEGVELKEIGNKEFKEGQLDRAARSYRRGANILKKLKDRDEQCKSLLMALQTNLSMVCFQQQKYSQSANVASKALEVDPDNVKALYRRAIANRKRGFADEAKKDLKKAVSLDPQNTTVRKEWVVLKKELEDSKKAQKESLRKAFEGSSFLYDDKEAAERKRAKAEAQRKKQEQEEYKKHKQQWEDECVSRMARNEPAISFEDWDKERKEKLDAEEKAKREEQEKREKERKERERERRKAEKKEESDDDDDDELTEAELAMMRGYKKTKDGRTTSYFTRELSAEEKSRMADIAPKRLDATSSASTPKPTAAVASAWNQAGTWEEKDTTAWCQDKLKERLESTTVTSACDADITKVDDLSGHASVAIAGGKKRYIFEFHGKLEYEMTDIESGATVAKGVMRLPDICSTSHDEVEVTFDAYKTKPSLSNESKATKTRKALTDAVRLQIQRWVTDFNNEY